MAQEEAETSHPLPEQSEKNLHAELNDSVKATELVFPTVYLGFNRIDLAQSELPKLQTILELLNQYPDLRITIIGWCDTKGSRAVNNRYSLHRVQTMKAWFTKNGIVPSRITVRGAGSGHRETDAAKARRADTTPNRKEIQL